MAPRFLGKPGYQSLDIERHSLDVAAAGGRGYHLIPMEIPADRETPRRCELHNLAAGPDGRCVLCRRAGVTAPARGRRGPFGLAAIVVALLGPLVALFILFYSERGDRAPAPTAELSSPPPEPSPQPRPPRGEVAKNASRSSPRRGGARDDLAQARQRVEVTMYMTPW